MPLNARDVRVSSHRMCISCRKSQPASIIYLLVVSTVNTSIGTTTVSVLHRLWNILRLGVHSVEIMTQVLRHLKRTNLSYPPQFPGVSIHLLATGIWLTDSEADQPFCPDAPLVSKDLGATEVTLLLPYLSCFSQSKPLEWC